MSAPGVFVTGTDTGVGKTVVACALLRALRSRGIRAGALKPIETGVGPDGPLDAIALREASGDDAPLAAICPQTFALPAAPCVAARAEARSVDLARLDRAFAAQCARHAFVVVEGAGGLLVPATPELSMADLAQRWRLPLVVVARAALGTINHTRLTLEAAAARGLPVAGLVISHGSAAISPADARNLEALLADPGARLLGVLPPLPPGGRPAPRALDLDPLLELLGERDLARRFGDDGGPSPRTRMSVSRPVFEPCNRDTWRDPYPMYAALREHDPVHRVPDNGAGEDYFVLSRFEHVFAAAVDAARFSSASGLTTAYDDMAMFQQGRETPIVMMDPPEHTALRKLAIKQFTPRQVQDLEPLIRAFAVERVEALRERGEGDVVETLFKPLPSLVVAHFLGVRESDRALFDRWTQAIVSANAGGDVLGAGDALGEMMGYFADLIEARRRDPGKDLISALVHGRLASGEAVSVPQILGMGFTLVTGGNDTTTGLLGGAAELLTRHPEQRALLIAEPARLGAAVEEFLRLSSPVQGLARTVTQDVEIDGTRIPKGRKVLLLYASANRDEREFGPTAADCDVTRRIRRHLALSYGPHHCIGAAAARLQARIALEELLQRCPDFAVDPEAGRFAPGPVVRRYESLPFVAKA